MISNIRQNIAFILQNADLLDYLIYGWVLLAFVLMLLIGVFCAIKWWWQIGFLVIFTSFFAFFVAMYFANLQINDRARKTNVLDVKTKQLEYSNTLLVDFNIENSSKKIFNICKVDLKFHTISKDSLKNYINQLNPFLVKTIFIKEPFFIGEIKPAKVIIENFLFVDYNITTRVECF